MRKQESPPDVPITPELFRQWRTCRFGTGNPERMNNPVWEWLIKTETSAFTAADLLKSVQPQTGPGWCFQRYGQSCTELSDGRLIMIAGEHEDYYDPDFCIYNDVVVKHPDGRIDICGYSREIFPPTDFHSATLVGGERIVIIGNLGYPADRRPGTTPAFSLDIATFQITPIATSGAPPGWIHKHTATLADKGAAIVVASGKLDRGEPDSILVENIDEWRLNLSDWSWERLTQRRWTRWEVRRKDGRPNHLFEIQQAAWANEHPEFRKLGPPLDLPTIEHELGRPPDFELYAHRYSPDVPHETLPANEEEYGVHRIRIEGVTIRYVEDMQSVQATIEGELPAVMADSLKADLLRKLSDLENAPCEVRNVD